MSFGASSPWYEGLGEVSVCTFVLGVLRGVPTSWQNLEKQGILWEKKPCSEKSGNLETMGKIREFYENMSGKSQKRWYDNNVCLFFYENHLICVIYVKLCNLLNMVNKWSINILSCWNYQGKNQSFTKLSGHPAYVTSMCCMTGPRPLWRHQIACKWLCAKLNGGTRTQRQWLPLSCDLYRKMNI